MTSTRRNISRGALLVALMVSSSALAGGAAYADVLGGAGPIPLPAPLPVVPVLTDPGPSPSPSPSPTATAAPAPAEQPAQPTSADPPAASGDSSAGSSDASSSSSTSGTQEVAATNATAPAPVAAPAPAPSAAGPVAARPVTTSPGHAAVPMMAPGAQPLLAPVDSAPTAATPRAAARLDLADGQTTNTLGSFSGFPQLSAGSLTLPGLPELPGLRPMIAPGQASPLAPLLTGSAASPRNVALVRAGHSSPVQPGPTGIVLFVIASAAGAAGLARVRIYRRGVVRR